MLPLGVIEASHFLGSVAGAALLILSQGLARRLDAAYYLASIVMVTGMVASLLKGFDYEEATLLLLVLVVLWRARPAFDRRAAFFDTRFSAAWIAALAGALGASVWLGFFAFKHVEYSQRALVAVRAARRGVAVSARVGRRGPGPAAVRARPARRLRAARGAGAN